MAKKIVLPDEFIEEIGFKRGDIIRVSGEPQSRSILISFVSEQELISERNKLGEKQREIIEVYSRYKSEQGIAREEGTNDDKLQ